MAPHEGMSLFFNGLEEDLPCRIELGKNEIGTSGLFRHLADEVSEPVTCLHAVRPMHVDAVILRLFHASFDKLATGAEGVTPQRRVIIEEDLVIDVASRKLVMKQFKHLQIEVAQRVKHLNLLANHKVNGIIDQHIRSRSGLPFGGRCPGR